MENATKALLIAGSILIAILLIAMGVKIFNSTSGTAKSAQSTMDATEVAMFNNKWLKYVGNNKNKSTAISLLNDVIVNNSTNSDKKVGVQLYGEGNEIYYDTSKLQAILNGSANPGGFYNHSSFNIKVFMGDGGYVNKIGIYRIL